MVGFGNFASQNFPRLVENHPPDHLRQNRVIFSLSAFFRFREPLNRVPYGKMIHWIILPTLLIFCFIGCFARCDGRLKKLFFREKFLENLQKNLFALRVSNEKELHNKKQDGTSSCTVL
jgi:hypothetical protein